MMKLPVIVALLCQSGVALRAASTTKDTPVNKVIQLLNRLSNQIKDEGAKEAAEYDKFACFCKEQADEKNYNIERSEEKIKSLTEKIDKLDGEIKVLDQDAIDLGKRIDEIDKEVKTLTDDREKEQKKWETDDKDMEDAIKAVREASEAIRESKKEMKEASANAKTDGDGTLLQLPAATRKSLVALLGLAAVQANSSPAKQNKVMALLQQLQDPMDVAGSPADAGKPAVYKYHSNEVLDILAELLEDFKKQKKDLWDTEFEARTAYDSKKVDLDNEKQFKSESKAIKEKLSAEKTVEKTDAEADKKEETTAKDADEAFKTELTTQCQDKAKEWDQRSTMRADEIKMLHEAAEVLKNGVASNYGANDKLVGLTQKSRVVSFLQQSRRNSDQKAQVAVVNQAVQLLDQRASTLKSSVLMALAAKVALNTAHFEDVQALIKDLIKRLEDDAKKEADHKTYCDEKMTGAVEDRDGEALNAETAEATIVAKTAEKKALEGDIAELSGDIAEMKKAILEQTELRAEEKVTNEKTLADAEAGKEAVGQAIKLLKDFYGAFVQVKAKGPDRDGDTVKDLAPELSYKGDYEGKKDASKGVIGLLETIETDFDNTITRVTQDEADAVTDFDTFKTDTDTSVGDKETEKSTKTDDVGTAESDIVTAKDSLKDAESLHEKSLEELEKLRAMCVEGDKSAAEKKQNREDEIKALNEALAILTAWKK